MLISFTPKISNLLLLYEFLISCLVNYLLLNFSFVTLIEIILLMIIHYYYSLLINPLIYEVISYLYSMDCNSNIFLFWSLCSTLDGFLLNLLIILVISKGNVGEITFTYYWIC